MNKQQLIKKYAKKFASHSDKHPLFQGIYYANDCSVVITNRDYAIRIQRAHEYPVNTLLHHKTGEPIKGEYPDVSRVFPDTFEDEIIFTSKELPDVLKRAKCAAEVASLIFKGSPVVRLEGENGQVQLRFEHNDIQFTSLFGFSKWSKLQPVGLNAEYLHTALSVFHDVGADKVWIKFGRKLTPILLTDHRDIDIIILPYRRVYE